MNNKAISGDFTETLKQLLLEIKTDLGDEQLFALNLDATLKDLATFEPNIEPEEEEEPTTKEKLRIIIECSNTDEHIELFQEFVGRGLSVRVA
jgi:HEPN domain-containing protein